MKKILLISMIGLFLFSESAFATGLVASNPSAAGIWIKLIIIFHKPRFDCERGFGICLDFEVGGVDVDAPMVPKGCPVKCQINEMGKLVMQVSETDLMSYENGSTLPYFKHKSYITIEDPYILSQGSCKSLGLTSRYTIKPGNYTVTSKDGVYTVVF